MTYPFVPAPDHWARATPIRAIAIHMAEGGGTVSWLQRPDGNSSHYVVEYTGRVVQMVREDRAAGSINPKLLRKTDDSAYTYLGESITYGVTAAKACLGPYWSNPNSAVIAIEIEGFAKNGPNDKQRLALRNLVADIRSRHPDMPCLGHRDFQAYKACPGKLIPWKDYGGHAAAGGTDDVPGVRWQYEDSARSGWVEIVGENHEYLNLSTGELHPIAAKTRKRAFGIATLVGRGISGPADPRKNGYIINKEAAFVITDDVVFEADPTGAGHVIEAPLYVDGKLAGNTTVKV